MLRPKPPQTVTRLEGVIGEHATEASAEPLSENATEETSIKTADDEPAAEVTAGEVATEPIESSEEPATGDVEAIVGDPPLTEQAEDSPAAGVDATDPPKDEATSEQQTSDSPAAHAGSAEGQRVGRNFK